MQTALTTLLGIDLPILCGGLYGVSNPTLVAAVSNAGGLAFLASGHLSSANALREAIQDTKNKTQKPFGVNVSLLSESKSDLSMAFIKVIIEEQIKVVETSGNNPENLIKLLKPHGVTILHKVVTSKHALKAEKAGADGIILVGYSAGGHPGMYGIDTMTNLQDTLKKVCVPVVAAGGFYTGKSMASALLLGASGVLMGTAFSMTEESCYHPKLKQRLVDADVTDTVVIFKSVGNAFRCLKNECSETVLKKEAEQATPQELFKVLKDTDVVVSYTSGETEQIVIPTGQVVGLIREIKSCRKLIEDLMFDCQNALNQALKF